MQVRNIILGGIGAFVLLVFFKLVWDSQSRGAPAVKDRELQEALLTYRQLEARRSAETRSQVAAPSRRSSKKQTSRETESVTEDPLPFTAPAPAEEEETVTGQMDLKVQMNEANRMYDKADYEAAKDAAIEILDSHPNNVRMLRIVVSSSCIMGEAEQAQRYYKDLPTRDQRQMHRRCSRYGVEFEE